MICYLSLRQVIQQCGYSDFKILAGEAGLDTRKVKTVCVVDIPDIEGWVYGGEFLLTSGYIFQDDPERLIQLIETANKYGAAALGIKMERYIDRVPQSVLRIADKLAFPVIGIPSHYAHTDIINPVLITISEQTLETMNLSDNIHKEFIDIILSDGSIDNVLALLNKYISRELLYVDIVTGERFAYTTSVEFSQLIEDVPLASLSSHFPNEKIYLNDKLRGYLFIEKPISDTTADLVMKHAKEALLLLLKAEHDRWQLIKGREAQLIQDILYKRFRHDSEIINRGRSLGVHFAGEQVVLVVGINNARSMGVTPHEPYIRAFEALRLVMQKLQNNVPYTPLEDEMAFILQVPKGTWAAVKTDIVKTFKASARNVRTKTGLQLAMGVGSVASSVFSCNKSFREASKALVLAQHGSKDEIIFWDDVGAYKFLIPIQNSQESIDFINEYLGELIYTHNEENDSLLNTLFCLINANWHLKSVAEAMNLHYNTVKYRYKKIGNIIDKDIDSPSVRLNLAFAMELYNLNKLRKENMRWED